jgi:tRNA (guanosine-2'-O-)-methyltransferase
MHESHVNEALLRRLGLTPTEAVRVLATHLSEERQARIEQVLDGRTTDVACVVEGVANSGNVNAVMRTAEALGFLPFHIVQGEAPFKHSRRTTKGAQKWLDVYHWVTPAACVRALKEADYQVVVLALAPQAVPLETIDFTRRTALVLGNEMRGSSPAMQAAADQVCVLPSPGFVESYNISVAAGMALYSAYAQRTARLGRSGNLTLLEREDRRADYYIRSVREADAILERWSASGRR